MNPLPPQAYTKETLGKAFAWLQAQPEPIKEFATSPDILVSLYLKAKLNGVGALERPSIQNFKNELKSLAGMMGEFEVMEPTAASEAMLNCTATRVQMHPPQQHASPPPLAQSPVASTPIMTTKPAIETTQQASPKANLPDLDAQSEFMIREVKVGFNLSSDQEALRLLISTGFKSLQKL